MKKKAGRRGKVEGASSGRLPAFKFWVIGLGEVKWRFWVKGKHRGESGHPRNFLGQRI